MKKPMKTETLVKIRKVTGVLILLGWIFVFFVAPLL